MGKFLIVLAVIVFGAVVWGWVVDKYLEKKDEELGEEGDD